MPSGICVQRRPRSACVSAQSDQGLHCLLTESLDTTEYEWRARAAWYFTHAQDDNLRILYISEGTYSLGAAQILFVITSAQRRHSEYQRREFENAVFVIAVYIPLFTLFRIGISYYSTHIRCLFRTVLRDCDPFSKDIIQSNLVISNALISNYRLSRSENLAPVLT